MTYIVIPARYHSTRFPGKPLALLRGMSVLERVWRTAQKSRATTVCIATDHEEIASTAKKWGATVSMTSTHCKTGTDRVAEATQHLSDPNQVIIGLQGDAVLTPPWVIDALITAMEIHTEAPIATPVLALRKEKLHAWITHKAISPTSGTSVVCNGQGYALYFSKQLLPFQDFQSPEACVYRHIGLYAYRLETLRKLQALPSSSLEQTEGLECLRALENGIPILTVCVDYQGRSHGSVNTKEDLSMLEKILEEEGELI